MPKCAASEPWWHLPSLGTFVFSSKVQFPRCIRSCFCTQEHFSLVQKEEQEALGKGHEGRDMKWSCRRWGRTLHVWVWDCVEQKELPPEMTTNDMVERKRAATKKGVTEAGCSRQFGFCLWFQPLFNQMGPTYLQHSSACIYPERALSWLQWYHLRIHLACPL